MPKISVIIPVYNTEKYVGECIESVLAQTMPDFELILVDDGSPDRAGAICDEYADRDTRIRVIHKPNGGVSSARNEGINASTGKWLCFCDSDDTMPSYALASLFKVSESLPEVQLIVGKIEKEGQVVWQPKITDYSRAYNVQSELDTKSVTEITSWSPCAKIVKGDIVRNNNLFFDTELCAGEDPLWNFFLSKHLISVAYCDEILYHYRPDNPNSANNATDKTCFYCSVLKVAQKAAANLSNPPKYGENYFVLWHLSVRQLYQYWERIQDRESARRAIKNNRAYFLHSKANWVVKYAAIYLSWPYWLISNNLFKKLFYNQPMKLFIKTKELKSEV